VADDSRTENSGVFGSYAAIGDSFTEGVGDPGPDGRFVGWADRFAVLLADRMPEHSFRYANLAVRGRLLDQIVEEQVPRARQLAPDLVTFCAGGNDIIRFGSDPDDVAERFERAVADLAGSVGTVMVTTGFDTRDVPVLRHLRGKIATYTAHVRAIADRYDCPVLDLWSLKSVQDRRAWDADRLHLSPEGHTRVALRAAQVLGIGVPALDRAAAPRRELRRPRGGQAPGPAAALRAALPARGDTGLPT
jgi:lysophospholipase L1-like esterase